MTESFSTTTDDEYLNDFEAMSEHGRTAGGGVDRQAATAADHETRAWFAEWLREHGLRVTTDEIGNQFGCAELVPGAPWVLVGSHLDSQPLGGRYDGAYGVLAGAHAVARTAAAASAGRLSPVYNVAVVNWFNEEGSRFAPSMMGSAVFTGSLPLSTALGTTDPAGATVAEALGDALDGDPLRLDDIACYGEIHIEQGRLLENAGTTIGLVDRTWAARKFRVTVHGEQSHTGSTVMRDRKDALYGAALVVTAARELADEFPDGVLHTAVSELHVLPNSPVTVAREVRMNLDLRSADEAVIDEALARLEQRIADAEQRSRTRVDRVQTHAWGLMPYHPEGVELARSSANDLDLSSTEIMTVAGHDSTNMKDVVPTVMLFVPSVEGVSHNEGEYTRDEDATAGLRLLTDVTSRLVSGALTAQDSAAGGDVGGDA